MGAEFVQIQAGGQEPEGLKWPEEFKFKKYSKGEDLGVWW